MPDDKEDANHQRAPARKRPPPVRVAGISPDAAPASRGAQIFTSTKSGVDRLLLKVRLHSMNVKSKPDSVWFTTKGQIVIPAWLRREFHIENGTRAVVQSTTSAASCDTTTWGANDPTWSFDGRRIGLTLFGSILTVDAQL